MEAPTLKLTVEKGPKDVEGKTKECKLPRSNKIRIGRVVKGNNFTIKDEGISSNHLLIEFNTTTSKWVLSDLDSSNGTFLNSVQIDANTEHVLKNGDTIKIGGKTSMKVAIDGEEDPKLKPKQTKGGKKTAKSAAAADVSDEADEAKEVTIEVEEQKLKPKQTRAVKKTARSTATVSASNSVAADGVKEVEEVDMDGGARQLRRNARRGVAAAPPVVEKAPVVAKNQGRRGRSRNANVELESVSVGVAEMEVDAKDEASNVGVGETSKSVEERESVKKEPCDGSDAVPSSTSEKSPQLETLTLARLQKMTLGEYFDYLEVYLVKQIREETDVINKGMIDKAERTKKYWAEQQKLKNKAPLA